MTLAAESSPAAIAAPTEAAGMEWSVLPLMERGDNASLQPDGAFFVGRDAPPVCFLYGPFWRLRQGGYRLSILCQAGEPKIPSAIVLGVEIIAETRVQLAWRDFTADEIAGGRLDIDFIVPRELSHDAGGGAIFEFRLFHCGNADITVSGVALRQMAEEPVAVLPRRCRLSGEADPRRALPPDADGFVAVRRWARSGQFLLRVGPPGGLPAARYRLHFRCRAGRPRNQRRPILGVEIVNGYVSHQADFHADELAGGSVSIDFAVPPELGIESGAAAPVAVKFNYLRNGSLAVGHIALELVDEVHPSPSGRVLPGRECCSKFPIKQIRRDSQKDLIIVGNCQAAIVYEGFRAVPALARYFRARFYDVNLRAHLYDEARRDLQNCDLLVVQDVADWEECPLREWRRDRAETIMFPCIRFASPWPFDGCNGPTDLEAMAQETPNFTFTYHDGLLARLRREIPDPEQRFSAYAALNFDGIPNYARAHQFETRRMLALDKKYDCTIGQFILDKFQSEQIFYTTNHPDRRIFELLIANIMRSLGIKGKIPPIAALDQLQTLQVPLHPLVAEALGIRWATPDRKYRFRQEELTWEEYVRRYIEHYG